MMMMVMMMMLCTVGGWGNCGAVVEMKFWPLVSGGGLPRLPLPGPAGGSGRGRPGPPGRPARAAASPRPVGC